MLRVNKLNVAYGASQALYDVSMQAEVGKVTCVLGRNGVGKTTLMKALSGQLGAMNGQVRWLDDQLDGMSPADRARRGIAYVPQGRDIFAQLTVEENLETAFSALPRSQRRIEPEIFSLFPVLQQKIGRAHV